MTIARPVAWGRTGAEYAFMFGLGGPEEHGPILDVAGGPASFTAEWNAGGGKAIACDPLYAMDRAALGASFDEAEQAVRGLMQAQAHRFVWTTFPDIEALVAARRSAARRFLADFEGRDGRYVAGRLPQLPFASNLFEIALCSHFLFLYSDAFDAGFHLAAIEAMLRVAEEARIFPLLDMAGEPSPHLPQVIDTLETQGLSVRQVGMDYAVQRGGNTMFQISRPRA